VRYIRFLEIEDFRTTETCDDHLPHGAGR
jgi:hypothetical protein